MVDLVELPAAAIDALAAVRPDNTPSRLLIGQYGFVAVGERWDDEDCLETIFEVAAGRA